MVRNTRGVSGNNDFVVTIRARATRRGFGWMYLGMYSGLLTSHRLRNTHPSLVVTATVAPLGVGKSPSARLVVSATEIEVIGVRSM